MTEKLASKLEEKIRSLDVGSCMDAIVLPLHGSLPPEMQVRVFNPPPPNCRRFIVATNIAETSLTVDGVVSRVQVSWFMYSVLVCNVQCVVCSRVLFGPVYLGRNLVQWGLYSWSKKGCRWRRSASPKLMYI